MELDPFLALDYIPATPPVTSKAANSTFATNGGGTAAYNGDSTAASSRVKENADSVVDHAEDPVASLLGTSTSNTTNSAKMKLSSSSLDVASAKSPSGKSNMTTPEDLNEELATLLLQKQLPQTSVTALQNLLRENASLKEKNQKLKSLLGRSAKAQRDAKNELEAMKSSHEAAQRDVERLEKRVEVLANRPTHMDLLADFETNFDRALLSIGGKGIKSSQQSGGENAAESSSSGAVIGGGVASSAAENANDGMSLYDDAVPSSRRVGTGHQPSHAIGGGRSTSSSNHAGGGGSDSLLLTELNESKSRIAQLESLNSSFQSRYNNLEQMHRASLNEQTSAKNAMTNLQLELRMSRMETEHALRGLREKEAIVDEMQLEINLVTQSAVEANKRAAEGMEVVEMAKSDREYVDGLEAKVVALQEWALASTESKRLTAERCRGLETRVNELEGAVKELTSQQQDGLLSFPDEGPTADEALSGAQQHKYKRVDSSGALSLASVNSLGGMGPSSANPERKLWTRSSSLVVGAGMVGLALLELSPDTHIEPYETVILRWKFDLTPADLDIYFSVLKGVHEDRRAQRTADACFRRRHVKGGGGGDVSGAFAVQNACTLVWSNEMSWVRPRTIKWSVDAVAIEWND